MTMTDLFSADTVIDVEGLLGHIDDRQFAGRSVVHVDIGWGDARKHRQLVRSDAGHSVRIRLPRGSFLADGAVLFDDGRLVVVVRRTAEPAVVVDFADNGGSDGARRMLLLGYLLGNQHAPLDVTADRVATPLMTSVGAAEEIVASLEITGRVEPAALARHGWSNTSADHHSHSHDHAHSHDHSHDDSHSHDGAHPQPHHDDHAH
ncbi:urease accessory protein UreE [Gordonia desulfuricans]|uniref:Urease accessory protein UreE n=2 Tax=Gordonia desulfuricans TaxID=89051 RepID=A0A7K3LPE6_9ACTN|nr:urease accessory protein UreE [Gordonia desulfuricans]